MSLLLNRYGDIKLFHSDSSAGGIQLLQKQFDLSWQRFIGAFRLFGSARIGHTCNVQSMRRFCNDGRKGQWVELFTLLARW